MIFKKRNWFSTLTIAIALTSQIAGKAIESVEMHGDPVRVIGPPPSYIETQNINSGKYFEPAPYGMWSNILQYYNIDKNCNNYIPVIKIIRPPKGGEARVIVAQYQDPKSILALFSNPPPQYVRPECHLSISSNFSAATLIYMPNKDYTGKDFIELEIIDGKYITDESIVLLVGQTPTYLSPKN